VIQNQYPKPFIELSDGTLVLLALITKIFSDSSDIFFIEEPENSIHPKALYELMKLIRERSVDKQFIITTHSPYLLNMIKPEEVLVAEICDSGLSTISKLPDVKAIKKRLAKSFMSFGDIVFAQPDTEDGEEKVY
jgi:predicted ATPase